MKKIIYLVIIFLLGIFVTYISYNSNKFQNIYDMVDTAIINEEYHEVAKTFGGCCDTNAISKTKTDKVDVAVYNGTSIVDLTYGDERSYNYEHTYYIYLFNVRYDYTVLDGKNNDSAIIFKGENGNTYEYKFLINNYVNTDLIEKENFNKETALFKSNRSVIENIDTWNFMYINLNRSMVEYINTYLGNSDIVGFSLTDNKGNVVFETDVNLDFSQQFYSDTNDLIVNYNIWLEAYDKNENVSEAEKKFNEFYEPWLKEFNDNKEKTGYTFPYDSKHLIPNKVLWKTIGHLGIYSGIMFMFYLLFFHFDKLVLIFSRIFPRREKKSKKSKKQIQNKKVEVIDNPDNSNKEEIKE